MDKLSYRMLMIGTAPAGLLGLEELFNQLYDAAVTPNDDDMEPKLISGVRKHNFIPTSALKDYALILSREYEKFYRAKQGGRAIVARDYGTWQGHPREQIPWFPTISSELCNGCGKCLDLCAHDVYVKDEASKAVVVEPFLCIVGCCFCKSVCEPKAILFPSQDLLNNYRPKV